MTESLGAQGPQQRQENLQEHDQKQFNGHHPSRSVHQQQ
jgi:hypothetical protein